jgi:crotonobetainyl-CoA:carnitine CoA-transferase CaiB-like acyl-CoA transferase
MKALVGIRVVDFSRVRAGPWATRWLSAFGAEIIKIEWPENERGRLPSTTTSHHLEVNLNTSGNFNDTNVNEKSLSLNVRTAKGLDIVKRLIAVSDIVIENFSSRVLRNWGIGYDEQCKVKPDIVYVSMSGYGHTGRHHDYTTFGPVAQAVSGLTFLSGLPDYPPAGWDWSYMDDTGGMYGAMCAMTGLYHRNVTGQGQHIDLSQMVASVPLVGPALLDFTVNGRSSRRPATLPATEHIGLARRSPPITAAARPWHRTTPIAPIPAATMTGVSSSASLMRNGGGWCKSWGHPPGPTTSNSRPSSTGSSIRRNSTTGSRAGPGRSGNMPSPKNAKLPGVRALPVQSAEDRVEHDPQLRHREMYLESEHPALGRYKVQNAPFKLSETPPPAEPDDRRTHARDRRRITRVAARGVAGRLCRRDVLADAAPPPRVSGRDAAVTEVSPEPSSLPGPLAGVRVLELATETGQSCGKLLGDLGAVVKMEPPAASHAAVTGRSWMISRTRNAACRSGTTTHRSAASLSTSARPTGAPCSGVSPRRLMSFWKPFGPAICRRLAAITRH